MLDSVIIPQIWGGPSWGGPWGTHDCSVLQVRIGSSGVLRHNKSNALTDSGAGGGKQRNESPVQRAPYVQQDFPISTDPSKSSQLLQAACHLFWQGCKMEMRSNRSQHGLTWHCARLFLGVINMYLCGCDFAF